MEYTAEQISLLYENLWRNGFMVSGLAVAALAALFNGISQFWYLYSPRKIDFYHSLPVKRSRMFWYKSLQSLLYFLLPYLLQHCHRSVQISGTIVNPRQDMRMKINYTHYLSSL